MKKLLLISFILIGGILSACSNSEYGHEEVDEMLIATIDKKEIDFEEVSIFTPNINTNFNNTYEDITYHIIEDKNKYCHVCK